MHNLVLIEARKYIGIKFKHRGRNSLHGFDCLGLILRVTENLEIKSRNQKDFIYDINPKYGIKPDPFIIENLLKEHLYESQEIEIGNIALIKLDEFPRHLAIIGDYNHNNFSLIHAYKKAGQVCEHVMNDDWRRKITKVYKFAV